jgi:hypothetical protein
MRATDSGGYGGTIVVDIDGVRKASGVLTDDADAFQVLAARVRGRALPEMPAGVAGQVTSALAEVGDGLAALPTTLVAQAQELRVRALWAEIADQLLAGHNLSGSALADFKAAYASGLLTRYAEPWEADLAKAYAQKLKDGEHHGLLDQVESALGDAGSWAYDNVVVPTVNGAASLGNAVVNDPGDTASAILGGLIVAGGSTIEGGGTVLDATGVGAVAGVPLNALGAGVIATGAGVTAKGAAGLANYATAHPVDAIQRGVDRGDGRDEEGKFASGNSGHIAADKEAEGLQEYADENGRQVIPDKARATLLDGSQRYYDGLSPNPDGTYTGVEIKSGTSPYGGSQKAFDNAVKSGQPATATLNGRVIKITSVVVKRVP